jgi:uncharacterized phiE125 gp8 family phage protein
MLLSLVEPPDDFPLTLLEVRQQTKTEGLTEDDNYVTGITIPAVTERMEGATGRQGLLASYRLELDRFPCERWMEIPKPPLVADSVVITYLDTAGVLQTLDSDLYVVQAPIGPKCARGRVSLASGQVWPATLCQAGSVIVEFDAGYGDTAADVPALLRQAMLLDAGTLYRHRESVLTGVDAAAIELPLGSSQIYRRFRTWATQGL